MCDCDFLAFFYFLRPAFSHDRLGHPESLEYCLLKILNCCICHLNIFATLGLEESPVGRPRSGYIMCQPASQPSAQIGISLGGPSVAQLSPACLKCNFLVFCFSGINLTIVKVYNNFLGLELRQKVCTIQIRYLCNARHVFRNIEN